MEEALSFFRAFEVWIYLILGLGGLFYIRKFLISWKELQEASFGLERENAQSRLNQSAGIIVLIIILGVAEFIFVSVIAPSIPSSAPIPTNTLNILATATQTLPVETLVEETQISTLTPTPYPVEGGCVLEQVSISSPQDGDIVSGVVEIHGTANVPNFGFYKIEELAPNSTSWKTFQAGNVPGTDIKLGEWDTKRLAPGEYKISLIVVNNTAEASLPCVVTVTVTETQE